MSSKVNLTKRGLPLVSEPIVKEDYSLKDFLFNINKNYDNQINFVEFLNVVSLGFIKNKQKKKNNKYIDKDKVINAIKKGHLPLENLDFNILNHRNSQRRTITTLVSNIKKSERKNYILVKKYDGDLKDNKEPKKVDKNSPDESSKNIEEKHSSELFNPKITVEGEMLQINGKKYNIENFNDNIFFETTYLDELIEDYKQSSKLNKNE